MAKEKIILTEHQTQFLEYVSREKLFCKHFYLTGGTALSAFYLQHRVSEDLDFFSEEEYPLLPIQGFVEKTRKKLGIGKVDYRQFLGLHTYYLYFSKKDVLKVDFNYYPFPRIEKGETYNNLLIDSMLDIAVNKVHTLSTNPRARDFIDLYFIVREEKYDMHDLLMKAKAKFDWHIDPLQLGSRFFQAKNMKDFPRMLKPVAHKSWQSFFKQEARKLKGSILK